MSETKTPDEKKLQEQWLEVANSAEYVGLSPGSAPQLAKAAKKRGAIRERVETR
jgi:hypothetical protein